MKKQEKKKKSKGLWYFLGSVALATGMCLIVPKIIEKGSDLVWKKTQPSDEVDDDWGPEIVKKSDTEENEDGRL